MGGSTVRGTSKKRGWREGLLGGGLAVWVVVALVAAPTALADTRGDGPGYAVDWASWNTGTRLESGAYPGMCAEIGGGSPQPGVPASQWPCAGVDGSLGGQNQVWESTATSTYPNHFLRNSASRLCLRQSSTAAVQADCVVSDHSQVWALVPVSSDYFWIRSLTSGQCINVAPSPTHGSPLVVGTCTMRSSQWRVRDGVAIDIHGFPNLLQTIRPTKTPSGHFWASYFRFVNQGPATDIGGYMGLQTNSMGFSRAAIFSIWGGSVGVPAIGGGVCNGWDDAVVKTGEGGYGMSCVVPYAWSDGGAFNFHLTFAGYGYGPQTHHDTNSQPGKWWRASVNQTAIASIFVPGTHRTGTLVHMLSSVSSSFSEHFGDLATCSSPGAFDAVFDPPYLWNGGGRSTVDSDPVNRVGPDQRCAGSVEWRWDPAKASWGPVRFYK